MVGLTEGEADDVHGGGHVNGDGGVVGVVMKATERHGKTLKYDQNNTQKK
jgi:hypothetical protein